MARRPPDSRGGAPDPIMQSMDIANLPRFEGSLLEYVTSDDFARLERIAKYTPNTNAEFVLQRLDEIYEKNNCIFPGLDLSKKVRSHSRGGEMGIPAARLEIAVNETTLMFQTFYRAIIDDSRIEPEEKAKLLCEKIDEVAAVIRGFVL